MARRRRRRRAAPPIVPRSFLRRRSTRWLFAATITLTVGIVLSVIASQTGGDGPAAATPTPRAATTRTIGPSPTPRAAIAPLDLNPDPARLERAEVVDIIDGDTIDVLIGGDEERVRYYGIDTPERGDDCYGEAKDRNEELAGDTVLLLPDARDRDRGGRLLRYVFDEQGESIDAALIAEGLAHAWPDDGAYRDALVALEGQASAALVGCLWSR
jgi:micrococcal nuclease